MNCDGAILCEWIRVTRINEDCSRLWPYLDVRMGHVWPMKFEKSAPFERENTQRLGCLPQAGDTPMTVLPIVPFITFRHPIKIFELASAKDINRRHVTWSGLFFLWTRWPRQVTGDERLQKRGTLLFVLLSGRSPWWWAERRNDMAELTKKSPLILDLLLRTRATLPWAWSMMARYSHQLDQHPAHLYFYGYLRDVMSDLLNTDIFEIFIKFRFKQYH